MSNYEGFERRVVQFNKQKQTSNEFFVDRSGTQFQTISPTEVGVNHPDMMLLCSFVGLHYNPIMKRSADYV